MKVLVLGLGKSGLSAAQFLLDQGHDVIGVDRNPNNNLPFPTLQESEVTTLQNIDQVILSPGIPMTHPLCQQATKNNIEIIGEIELACRHMKNPCVGVTGTNGKTTVTLLVEHTLNFCGIIAEAVGNVGTPLTSKMNENAVFVLELSSFQLETMSSKVLDAAAILNITPDHLDRYSSMNDYIDAKMKISDCLKPEGMLYIEYKTLKALEQRVEGRNVISYRGEDFNAENELAAFNLCRTFGVTYEQFAKALKTFKKPPHRLEFVDKIEGISYYNDSKGTNIDAVMRAVGSLPNRIVLIAGGLDKGSSYKPWIEGFKDCVSAIFTIGEASPKIEQDLKEKFPVITCHSLENALNRASEYAESGDAVLLSPGCASFDMFDNFEHRGNEFKRLVKVKGECHDH